MDGNHTVKQLILLRIYLRLLKRYGERALIRRLQGDWLEKAARHRASVGRSS